MEKKRWVAVYFVKSWHNAQWAKNVKKWNKLIASKSKNHFEFLFQTLIDSILWGKQWHISKLLQIFLLIFRTLCIVKSWQYDDDYDDARTGVYWRLLRNIQVLMLINQKAKGKIPEDNQEFLLEMKTNGL